MAASSFAPRLTDIVEAIEHIRSEMAGLTIDAFEADWRKRWLVERGSEMISEVNCLSKHQKAMTSTHW
jgi:hypothetical protein